MRNIDTGFAGTEVSSDCNLKACGAWNDGEYFHARFPDQILDQTHHISQRELITVVVTLKIFRHKLHSKKIHFHCDNQAAMMCVNSGRTKDEFMQRCLREIVYLAAIGKFEVRMSHISTNDNEIPDALSRWYDGLEFRRKFRRLIQGKKVKQIRVQSKHFSWSCKW